MLDSNTLRTSTEAMTQHFNGTRKDYAASLGLAKRGKGRMSLEATAAVNKAIADGMTFSDYRISKASPDAAGPVVEKAGPQDQTENVYADAYMRYEMDQEFTYSVDGKAYVISARPACMTCGFSLVGHTCSDPVVLTYHGAQRVKPKGE